MKTFLTLILLLTLVVIISIGSGIFPGTGSVGKLSSVNAVFADEFSDHKNDCRNDLVKCLKKGTGISDCFSQFQVCFRSGRVEDPSPCEKVECPGAKKWARGTSRRVQDSPPGGTYT